MERRRPPAAVAAIEPRTLVTADLAAGSLRADARLDELELSGVLAPGTVAAAATIDGCRIGASARLAGAVLDDLHLRGTTLAGADLANVRMHRALIERCTLRDCRMTGADLTGARLRDVTFSGCLLDLTLLGGARLERVGFEHCVLRDAMLEQCRVRDTGFSDCDLSGVSIGQVRLERVEFEDCRLDGLRSFTDLSGAAIAWPDIVANAAELAAALGIGVLDRSR